MSSKSRLLLVVLFAGVLPWVASVAAQRIFGSAPWMHETLHETIEVAGSCIALGVATLLLLRVRHDPGASYLLWVVAGLVVMGLVDGVHALVEIGVAWSWLRHGATFLGGVLFGLIWVPLPAAVVRHRNLLVLGLGTLACGFAAGITWLPDWLPAPWTGNGPSGTYTLPAKAANAFGGLGFIAAALYFFRRHLRESRVEDLVFASHTVLLGTAGVLFGFGHLWNPDWWVWHFARLLAYGVLLAAAYGIVVALYRDLARNAAELESRVEARTAELSGTALFPEENPFPVLRATHDGTLLYANRSAMPLLKDWKCARGGRMPEFVRQAMMKALECGASQELAVCVGERNFSLVATPIAGRDYINFYGADITERKRAVDALQESERRYRSLFESMDEGFCVMEVLFDLNARPNDWRFLEVQPGF